MRLKLKYILTSEKKIIHFEEPNKICFILVVVKKEVIYVIQM